MKPLLKIASFLVLVVVLAGCNDADDVTEIFTGKTWKLTFIARDGEDRMYNFWGDNETGRQASLSNLEDKRGSFTVIFEGTEDSNFIQGGLTGTSVNQPFNGTWSADGESRRFSASVSGNDEGDVLAQRFLEGLNNAESYEGDSRNLYLIYKSGSNKYRMFFHVMQ